MGSGGAFGLVARTGVEPVISALRGRRPKPLDERAYKKSVASLGLEPRVYRARICRVANYTMRQSIKTEHFESQI